MERVNLLPWRQQRQQRYQRTHQRWWLAITFGLLMIVLTLSQRLKHLVYQQHQQWQTAQQYYQQQQSLATIQRKYAVNQTDPYEHPAVRLLRRLPELTPSGIYLQQFTWRSSRITLQGNALSYALLVQWIDRLKQQASVSKIQLLQANLDHEQTPTALIQFQLQGYELKES